MDEEVTEVGMELTDMVFEQFLEDFSQELLLISKTRLNWLIN